MKKVGSFYRLTARNDEEEDDDEIGKKYTTREKKKKKEVERNSGKNDDGDRIRFSRSTLSLR